jgi:hypothetical protein
MSSLPTINGVQSIAASGTATVVIPVPNTNIQDAIIQVSAVYASVAATSGVTAAFSYSTNAGVGYTASNAPGVSLNPAATVLATDTATLKFGNEPFKVDPISYPDHLKVSLTNLDATNAVEVVVSSQLLSHQL